MSSSNDAAGVDGLEEMMTVCLTEGGASSRRHILKIAKSSSVQELVDQCQALYGSSSSKCQLHHGFPPRLLDPAALDKNCSLEQAGIQNQDRIQVTLVPLVDTNPSTAQGQNKKRTTKEIASSPSTTTNTTSTAATSKRSKRAAAVAAEASFADTIRHQDMLLKQDKQPPTKKKPRSSPASQRQSSAKPPRFQAASTVGRRLQDGAAISPRKKRPPSASAIADDDNNGIATSHEEAGALELLHAVDGSHSSDRMSRLMRSNWKQAVNSAYEQNQAVARLAAIASGQVQWETQGIVATTGNRADDTTADSTTSPASLVVTHPKGVQGRGNYVDRVDFLPLTVLQSVIAAIYPENPEALRSENLALLSPRVLWSLVYHTTMSTIVNSNTSHTHEQSSATTVISIEAALRQVQPDLDWSFMRRRKEQLSEKARENLRQQQAESQAQSPNDWDAAAAAIESVEVAMANLSTLHRTQRAAQCSQAASQRVSWNLVTPSEVDEDELKECIGDSVPNRKVASIVKSLLHLGVHNWRELANADVDQLSTQLKIPDVPTETVSSWIDKAQEESIEEIMVEICGGSVTGVELLREVNSATPQDLALWQAIVPNLHQALQVHAQQHVDDAAAAVPSIEELQQWCDRAQRAMDQLSWLGLFSTPL